MRALLRYCLAPFVTAAVLSAAPAYLSAGPVHASAAPAHASVTDITCPPGTHWDHTLQACV